jgi:hypothetical protein
MPNSVGMNFYRRENPIYIFQTGTHQLYLCIGVFAMIFLAGIHFRGVAWNNDRNIDLY